MLEPLFIARLVHIVTGLGWLGEVLTVNFVLLPALMRVDPAVRSQILVSVFPLVFRLATVLGGLAIVSGAVVFWIMSDGDPGMAFGTTWGQRILVGGLVAGPLFVFHLFHESHLEGALAQRLADGGLNAAQSDRVFTRLLIIPRIGALMLLGAALFMSAAARLS